MRRLWWVIALSLGCGARTGLEQELSRDAGLDVPRAEAGLRDADTDAPRDVPRCPFDLDAAVIGTVVLSVDDNARFFANGVLVDEAPRVWSEVGRYEIPLFRHPERPNVIAIEGINTMEIDGRDRGVLFELRAVTEVGEVALGSDETWRLSTREEPGWFEIDHPEDAWRFPVLEGAHGIAPWGPLFGASGSQWLWSYDSDLPAASKPERERIFLRRRFFFDVAGRIDDAPSRCP